MILQMSGVGEGVGVYTIVVVSVSSVDSVDSVVSDVLHVEVDVIELS